MSWFDDLTPTAQKAYIAKHPNSKYKKMVKQKNPNKKGPPASSAFKAKQKIKDNLKFEENELKRYVEYLKRNSKITLSKKNRVKATISVLKSKIAGLRRQLSK